MMKMHFGEFLLKPKVSLSIKDILIRTRVQCVYLELSESVGDC